MTQKTAMMELIETLEHWADKAILTYEKRKGILIAAEQAKRLLEKEKHQIMDSYSERYCNECGGYIEY